MRNIVRGLISEKSDDTIKETIRLANESFMSLGPSSINKKYVIVEIEKDSYLFMFAYYLYFPTQKHLDAVKQVTHEPNDRRHNIHLYLRDAFSALEMAPTPPQLKKKYLILEGSNVSQQTRVRLGIKSTYYHHWGTDVKDIIEPDMIKKGIMPIKILNSITHFVAPEELVSNSPFEHLAKANGLRHVISPQYKYILVSQFLRIDLEKQTVYDLFDLLAQAGESILTDDVKISETAETSEGYGTYEILPGGKLKFIDSQYDSSG